ncbi:MAG TPA: endonuclease domain-containing protein [Bryobacteraceae bacterium]|nr:endonuclease domain-containing protein [Bryobacteraceae bacterium]
MDTPKKVALARKMRKALTGPEWLLWERLKERRDGIVFRRQHPVGPYILDFYCFKAALVIEVDGAVHGEAERAVKDETRQKYLEKQGLFVHRVSAAEVYRNPDVAADGIRILAEARVGERK